MLITTNIAHCVYCICTAFSYASTHTVNRPTNLVMIIVNCLPHHACDWLITQWHNSWGGGRGQSAPLTCFTGKFLLNWNWKWKGTNSENELRTFVFVLFCFFACHFLRPLKFVLGLPKWTSFTWKSHISHRKNIGKGDFAPGLCPLWKIFLLRHCNYLKYSVEQPINTVALPLSFWGKPLI